MVEMTGFEPATSASRTQRSTKLSHISLLTNILYHRGRNLSSTFFKKAQKLYRTAMRSWQNRIVHYRTKSPPELTGGEAHCSIMLLVGVTGFEPAASTSQMSRAPNCATPRFCIEFWLYTKWWGEERAYKINLKNFQKK